MMRFWQNQNEDSMRIELIDYFYGYFDSLESFNNWRYPICNSICHFEKDSQNPMARTYYDQELIELLSLIQSYYKSEWTDFKRSSYWLIQGSPVKQHIELYFVRVFDLAFIEVFVNIPWANEQLLKSISKNALDTISNAFMRLYWWN